MSLKCQGSLPGSGPKGRPLLGGAVTAIISEHSARVRTLPGTGSCRICCVLPPAPPHSDEKSPPSTWDRAEGEGGTAWRPRSHGWWGQILTHTQARRPDQGRVTVGGSFVSHASSSFLGPGPRIPGSCPNAAGGPQGGFRTLPRERERVVAACGFYPA